MNHRLLSLAVLGCCLLALATSAGSVDSAISTKPDDAVDIDSGLLPIGADATEGIKRQLQGREPTENTDSGDADSGESTVDSSQQSPNEPADSSDLADSQTDESKQLAPGEGDDSVTVPAEPSTGLLERLLALLRTALGVVFALGLLAVGALAAYRNRGRLLARLAALLDGPGEGQPVRDEDDTVPPETPGNAVEEAWYRTMEEFGLASARSKTPAECARRAIERGGKRAAIEPLTEVFTEVRYGDEPVTESRRQRASESRRICTDSHTRNGGR
ncbi:DUF4129 domain-containing protein [Haloarchaeobius baliensis]|uniref:DUF4129 domain-containing protein n=1 Tax=Haloarchaeobius baliensis TaxID=1670458 RepID=UPI003F881C00